MEPEHTFTSENEIITESPNPVNKILSKLKANLSRMYFKIKGKWISLPIKFRIATLAFSVLILFLGVYALFSGNIISLDKIRQITQKNIFEQLNEGWVKLQIPEREPAFFSLKPQTQGKYGILPRETFVLKTREPVSESFVKEKLKSSTPVRITSASGNEFRITTEGTLKNDEIITISLPIKDENTEGHTFDRNYGWTFQTQGKFRVMTSIPGDKKTNVPLNTGIEITFSQDDYNNPENLITIEPLIEWRGERHSETYSIVPLKPLNPKTVYTVTLKKGLNLQSRNDPINDDHRFTFQTQEEEIFNKTTRPPRMSLNKNYTQTATNEPPTVSVYSSNWNDSLILKTKVFKFSDSTQFINSRKRIDEISSGWYSYFAENERVSTENLALVSETDLKIQVRDNLEYIQFPQAFSPGFYLVQFWYEDGKKLEQLWIQSVNISAYTSVGRNQTLVWVNNISTGESIGQAEINPVDSGSSYSTSDNGIAVFSTPQVFYDNSQHYIKVSAQGEDLILPVNSLQGNTQTGQKNPKDYWSYLYHERYLYKPGDTVYFWGIVKDRDTGGVPSNVEVSIKSGYYYSETPQTSNLVNVSVTPDETGSFIGNFPLTNIPRGYYSLSLKADGVEITQSGLQVTEYEKPEMKIEVTSSKNASFTGEKIDFTAKVTFFDGTAAKQIPLNIYENKTGSSTQLSTDEKGEVKYTYVPKYDGSNDYYPRYESITINPALAQSSKIEGFGSVFVYGSKLMISSESRQVGSRAFAKAQVSMVNLDNINQGKSFDVKGQVVANKEVGLNITKTWWEKIEEGTYYDFIEKVTRPSYRYQRHDEKMTDTKLKTDNSGEISYEFDLEKDKSYQLTLSLEDEDKHIASVKEYYYFYEGYQDYPSDEFAIPELSLNGKDNSFSVGDNVKLDIKYKGENYADTDKNRFLFILAQRGSQDFFVEDKPELNFSFNQKNIPNTNAGAVIFTGKYYQTASPSCSWEWHCSYYGYYYEDYYFNTLSINYRQEDSTLDMNLSPDKDKYKPGDTVKIKVGVKKDGQSVPDTQVNLVLVDQALDAIGGVIKPAVLGNLYAFVPNEVYYNYYSHKPIFPKPSQAEMGGGGGEEREIFKDTPFFGQAKTDPEGIASFEFTLPDNITTWIIFAQGLTQNLDAGQTEGNLVASKEFFVTSNFPKEFLSKDISFITGNGFGNNIGQNQTVSYEVTVFQEDRELHKLRGNGKTLKDTSFQFPGLDTGIYKVRLKGTTGNQEDAVIYPFSVIESRLDLQTDKKFKVEKGEKLSSIDLPGLDDNKPVKLIISDIGRGQYFNQLFGYCHISSNRLEKNLAKTRANSIINERFGEEPCKQTPGEIMVFQNTDGGLSQVSWGGSVLETSVWAAYVDSNAFDKEKLSSYFERKLNEANSGNLQKIYSLWGLTLMGKPHINELLYYIQNSINFNEKALSALALATIGETELPRDTYFDLLSDYGYTNKPYIRIQSGLDAGKQFSIDNYVKDTGLILLLGSIVEKNYNEGLFLYVRDYQNQIEDIALDLGKISFINEELKKLPNEDTQVFFKSNSKEEILDLAKGSRKSISLLNGEIKNSQISVISGKTEIAVYYFVTPDNFSQIPKDNRLSIKKDYKKVKGDGNSIKPGDIIQITINFNLDKENAPLGGYTIKDHLPSGLTYIENPGMYGLTPKGWFYEESPNIIKYTFYNSPWWQKYGDKLFTYFARASAVGTYLTEPSFLQSHLDMSVIQATHGDTLKIESQN